MDEETQACDAIRRMLSANRIAIVGLSGDPARPSFGVAAYLLSRGKDVVPINPGCHSVMGLECYPSLESAPGLIDVVNVFRRPEHCADIARSTVAIGARGLWLQSGVISDEAEKIARDGAIDFVQDRCIKIELMYH